MKRMLLMLLCILAGMQTMKAEKEAYAVYSAANTMLTFYYDELRSSRTGTTYDLNTEGNSPEWYTDGTYASVTKVSFDASFSNYLPTTTCAWFYKMENLQSITGISRLNTSSVTNMDYMFSDCHALTSLDLTSFNTANVVSMNWLFASDISLKTIYVGDNWSMNSVQYATSMFYCCYSLVGEEGTAFDVSHMDAAYAHVDGGSADPGYLSRKPETYVCYTSENTTLTFYRDGKRSSRTGTIYRLNTDVFDPDWYSDGTQASVTHVVFDPSFANARPTTTCAWFCDMGNLQSIEGMEYLNTSKVINMREMFAECTKLTSIDLSKCNTANVSLMDYMFYNCSNLRTINVGSGWSMEKVGGTVVNMFLDCTSLVGGKGTVYDENHIGIEYAHIDGGPDNPGYLTADGSEPWVEAYACYDEPSTTLTFYYDGYRKTHKEQIYDLNKGSEVPGWYADETYRDVTHVVFDASFAVARPVSAYCWFYEMENLQSIEGMEYLNTSEVTTMAWMFSHCANLESVDLSGFNTENVKNMRNMFSGCESLESLDLSSFNTAKVTNMTSMFHFCKKLAWVDLGGFNTANVNNMRCMFYYCINLRTIYVGDEWSTASASNSTLLFSYCNSLVGGEGTTFDENNIDTSYAHVDGGKDDPGYFTHFNVPKAYVCYTPENTTLTFYYDTNRGRRATPTYALNKYSTKPGWYNDGSYANVTRVVFDSSFADVRPKTTEYWFYEMQNLQSITGLSNLNTSEVTDMGHMFMNCSSLTTLDLRDFKTAKVTDMIQMFSGCSNLTSLDLSSFNTVHVGGMGEMFADCSRLKTIYVGNEWSTDAIQSLHLHENMFYGCSNLVGGQGTHFDSNHTNKEYARIDGGTGNPGYLTAPKGFDYYVDGIYYKYDGFGTVVVVSGDAYGEYSGTLVIPELIEYDGWWYKVTGIGERAFFQCPRLKKVVIPASVDVIHAEAFADAFSENLSQSSITCLAMMPPQVLSASVFDEETEYYQSIGAMTLYVPYGSGEAYQAANGWKDFGRIEELNYSFVEDHIYYKITAENKVSVACKDENYNSYSGRKVIPETVSHGDVTYTVTAIDNSAFKDCTSLTKIVIPNSVTDIKESAFEGCTALKNVVLGSGLKFIRTNAFFGCTALEEGEVTCLVTDHPPILYDSSFDGSHYGRTIVNVPEGCFSTYQQSQYWQRFACLVEFVSLDKALNVEDGTISFSTDGDYPWVTVKDGDCTYARSGNVGVQNSISMLIAAITVPENGGTLRFDFLSFGSGQGINADHKCWFDIDGRFEFADGEIPYWDTYEVELPAGKHVMRWYYTKNDSENPQGDYFAIDNVALITQGDPNGDGKTDIQDALAIVNHILGRTPATFVPAAADTNKDGKITIADAVVIVNKLLNGK